MYSYRAGKLDWLAFGLPVQGLAASQPVVGRLAELDAPRCGPRERLADIRVRMACWDWCAVVDDRGTVVGRIRRRQLEESPMAEARDVMEPGPATYRPSLPATELLQAMREGGFESAFVTDSEGRWIGLVKRAALEAARADNARV